MKPILYGLKQCSSCIKARRWLEAQSLDYQFIDYRAQPIDPQQLTQWAARLGWSKLINRSSTTWRQLSADEKNANSDAEWLALAGAHPTLIKRPVMVCDDEVSVGFSAGAFAQRLL